MKSVGLWIFVTLVASLVFSATLTWATPAHYLENSNASPWTDNNENELRGLALSILNGVRVRRAPAPQQQAPQKPNSGTAYSAHITPHGTFVIPDGDSSIYLHGNPFRYSSDCIAHGVGCDKYY